jgi:hypothetical protein
MSVPATRFVSHPPPFQLRAALIASKPKSIKDFTRFFEIGSPLGKRKSGLRGLSNPRSLGYRISGLVDCQSIVPRFAQLQQRLQAYCAVFGRLVDLFSGA